MPKTSSRSETFYVHAFECGHRRWTSMTVRTASQWCPFCARRVEVIVATGLRARTA